MYYVCIQCWTNCFILLSLELVLYMQNGMDSSVCTVFTVQAWGPEALQQTYWHVSLFLVLGRQRQTAHWTVASPRWETLRSARDPASKSKVRANDKDT